MCIAWVFVRSVRKLPASVHDFVLYGFPVILRTENTGDASADISIRWAVLFLNQQTADGENFVFRNCY